MINRDYILRMIEQLSHFLSKALLMKDAKEYQEAIGEVKKAGKMFLGLSLEAVESLTYRDLVRLWSVGDDLDAERCALAAQIFRTEGEIYEHEGDAEKAFEAYEKSLGLLTETISYLREKIPHELIASVDFLSQHLDPDELSITLQKKLFTTHEVVGRFAKAEDLLFDILQDDPSFVAEGRRFYERLLKRTDQELENGNLPRGEVIQSLAELNQGR